MNTVQKFEQQQIAKLSENKRIDEFESGDTIRVNVKIIEGESERIQAFEGICIAKKNRGVSSSFTVRKISHGEGVERVFPLYSPRIDSVELVRSGTVRRAKLYYMRDLSGKAARIKEKLDFLNEGEASSATNQNDKVAAKPEAAAKPAKAKKTKQA